MTIVFFITTILAICWAYSLKKKQKIYNGYHEEVRAESWAYPSNNLHFFKLLNVDDVEKSKEKDPVQIKTATVLKYETEQIDKEIEEFYASLVKSVSVENSLENDAVKAMEEESILHEDIIPQDADCIEGTNELEDTFSKHYNPIILSASDWEENLVKLEPSLAALADCNIADEKYGLQSWVVKVIGKEQEYLHVADNTARTWINAEYFVDKKIRIGDILFIGVERSKDGLKVETLNILERSLDCLHPEQHETFHEMEYDEYCNERAEYTKIVS